MGTVLLTMCMGISSMSFAQVQFKSQTGGRAQNVTGWGIQSSIYNEKSLISASRSGDLESVRSFLRDENTTEEEKAKALTAAATNGYQDIIAEIVPQLDEKKGPIAIAMALGAAVENGYKDIVEFLLNYTDVDVVAANGGYTALMLAADAGDVEMVDFLIGEHHANVELTSSSHMTPLMIASQRGRLEVIKHLIIQWNANPDARMPKTYSGNYLTLHKGSTAVLIAAFYGQLEAMKVLINETNEHGDYHAYVNAMDDAGYTALGCSRRGAANGYNGKEKEIEEYLASQGVTQEHLNHISFFPKKEQELWELKDWTEDDFNMACTAGNVGLVEYYLKHHNVTEYTRKIKFFDAIGAGMYDLVKMFIENGWVAKDVRSVRMGPVGTAIVNGRADIVGLLLAEGFPVEEKNDTTAVKGATPLLMAAMQGDRDMVYKLHHDWGADIRATDNNGDNAYELVEYEIIKINDALNRMEHAASNAYLSEVAAQKRQAKIEEYRQRKEGLMKVLMYFKEYQAHRRKSIIL